MTEPNPEYFSPEQRARDAVKTVMGSRGGRRYVFNLLNRNGFLNSPFNPDPVTMGYNVGKIDASREIFVDIDTICPDLFLTMMKESKEDEDYDNRERARIAASSGSTGIDDQ